jgi:hypothetical protein
MRTEGRTKLINAFRNFANAPKNYYLEFLNSKYSNTWASCFSCKQSIRFQQTMYIVENIIITTCKKISYLISRTKRTSHSAWEINIYWVITFISIYHSLIHIGFSDTNTSVQSQKQTMKSYKFPCHSPAKFFKGKECMGQGRQLTLGLVQLATAYSYSKLPSYPLTRRNITKNWDIHKTFCEASCKNTYSIV